MLKAALAARSCHGQGWQRGSRVCCLGVAGEVFLSHLAGCGEPHPCRRATVHLTARSPMHLKERPGHSGRLWKTHRVLPAEILV
jgi:hypothetical protein